MRINKCDLNVLRNKLLAVYCNETDTNTFIVGKVLTADQDGIMLSLFAPDGSRDGFCLCAWERIFCIETDSRYLIDLEKCLPECQTWDGNPWDLFLDYARTHQRIIQLEDFQGKRIMFGIPVSYTQDTLAIRRVCLDGRQGEIYRLKRKNIAMMICDSIDERLLQKRYEGSDFHDA